MFSRMQHLCRVLFVLLTIGGATAAHADAVRKLQFPSFTIYEPTKYAAHDEQSMPLLLYLHGAPWFVDPALYDSLLREIADSGCVVVFPHYGERDIASPNFLRFDRWWEEALAKSQAGLRFVQNGGGYWTPPMTNLSIAGHSLGGVLSLKMSVEANQWWRPGPDKLPAPPRQLILHDAAGYNWLPILTPDSPNWMEDLRGLNDQTSLTVVVAIDSVVDALFEGDQNASAVWSRAWNRSGPLAARRAYLAYGGHFDVYGLHDFDLYVDSTISALDASRPFVIFRDPAPSQRFDWQMSHWFTR